MYDLQISQYIPFHFLKWYGSTRKCAVVLGVLGGCEISELFAAPLLEWGNDTKK